MKNLHSTNLWEFFALLFVCGVLCCFMAQKERYHMDELLSFELSNAAYNPWIVPTQPVGRLAKFMQEEIQGDSWGETLSNLVDVGMDVVKNKRNSKLLSYKADVYSEPVWIDRGQFHKYLTTGKRDRFQYVSVYFNVKDDNHPPLHFMLLHTMSSLFPGSIMPFLGCVINLFAILGCMVCMMSLGRLLEAHGMIPKNYGRAGGISAALLYGISAGGIATVLLIRMYGLLTFLCVLLFYLHVKKWLKKGFGKGNKALGTVVVLGFLTQYFFLFYCLILAAVTVGLLAAKKRFLELKRYIRTMALAAVVGVGVFPFSVEDILSSGRGMEALGNLGSGFAGYGARLGAFGRIWTEGSFGSLGFGLGALACLAVVLCVRIRRAQDKWRQFLKGEVFPLLSMLVLPVLGYFLLVAKAAPYLVDRYLMPLFPFGAMGLALLLGAVFEMSQRKTAWMFVSVLLAGVVNMATYDGAYLYQGYDVQFQVAKQYSTLPCICLYDGVGYYENLMEFTQYEKTLLLKLPELEQRQESIAGAGQMVVLKKSLVEEEAMVEALGKYGWAVEQVLLSGEDSVHGDTVYLCGRIVG